MRNARRRRELILEVIISEAVHTQEELAEALGRRGVAASQASLSRDVAALALVKVAGRYARPQAVAPAADPREERIRANLLSITPAGENLLVVRTPAGTASATALAVDGLALPGIVGTVAGDDTIFVAVEGAAAARGVARRLREVAARPLAAMESEA